MKNKKELLYLSLLVYSVPTLFFGLGLLNFFVIKNSEQGTGFVISGTVFTVLASLVVFFEWRHLRKRRSLHAKHQYLTMPIEPSEEDGIVTITASTSYDDKRYTFRSVYQAQSDGAAERIRSRMFEKGIAELKVWVDLKKPRHFEFDLRGLLDRLELAEPLNLLSADVHEKPEVVLLR